MEALFFLIDSGVMLVVVYYGLMDERRARGMPMRSPFRYFEGGRSSGIVAEELAQQERKRARSGSGMGARP